MVELEPLGQAGDLETVRNLLRRHVRYTNSGRAVRLLADWQEESVRFIKIIPRDYKRVLAAEARARAENREPAFAELVGASHG
jgi:glutamate synthase domain-containing protein 3